jgi:hypothetical protein
MAFLQFELAEDVEKILPLLWKICLEDRAGMMALFDLVR